MQLTQFTDYSMRVLIYLGLKNERATVAEISAAFSISNNHLVKVVNRLANLGVIRSQKGRLGGITLRKKMDEINIGDLISKLESNLNLVDCFDRKNNTCKLAGFCELEKAFMEARRAFISTLGGYTLADLARIRSEKQKQLLFTRN